MKRKQKITFKQIVQHFGTKAELARAVGVTRGAVHHWGEKVPPHKAIVIERVTRKKFTRYQIRPDHFGAGS